jgi:hypothetical protein
MATGTSSWLGNVVGSVSDRVARRAHLLSTVLAMFTSYRPGEFPPWWTEAVEANIAGELCGAYELVKGARDGAMLVTNKGLGIVSSTSVLWIPYDNIVGWEPPQKTPPADSLVCIRARATEQRGSGVGTPFISSHSSSRLVESVRPPNLTAP